MCDTGQVTIFLHIQTVFDEEWGRALLELCVKHQIETWVRCVAHQSRHQTAAKSTDAFAAVNFKQSCGHPSVIVLARFESSLEHSDGNHGATSHASCRHSFKKIYNFEFPAWFFEFSAQNQRRKKGVLNSLNCTVFKISRLNHEQKHDSA